jgi:2-polyprenyl-3-methyl-5-hydroxy-6-metoxy-1,4-benzoquinol methylase
MDSLPNDAEKVDQHIYLSRDQLLETEKKIRIQRHIERYALLRQFAKGTVCDAACGCGYGSYLLSTNPDVTSVIGLDCNADIISFAQKEYESNKTKFFNVNIGTWVSDQKIDMLFSVETIEHIESQNILPDFCDRNNINHVILTYPSKKTTHYNPYHLYDFKLQDILDIFDKFTCYRHFNWEYEFDVVFLIRNP